MCSTALPFAPERKNSVDLWQGILRSSHAPEDACPVFLGQTDKKSFLHTLIVLCLLVPLLSQCGSSPRTRSVPALEPTAPLRAKAFYCPEEYLKWSLKWKGIEGASTEMVTGQPGVIDKIPAIIVYSVTRSSEVAAIFREVREELTSQISLADGRVIRNNSDTTEDGQNDLVHVAFSEKNRSYSLKLHGSVAEQSWNQREEHEIGDLHSFLAEVRAWDGAPETGSFAFMQSGRSHFRVAIAKAGSETLKTALGEIPSIRLYGTAIRLAKDGKATPHSAPRSFTLWRSDDERFLPLRFEVDTRLGAVRGTLQEYRQPNPAACITVR